MSQLIWKRRKWGEITAGNAGEDESGDDSRRIAAGNGRAEAAGGWLERAERTAVAAVEPVSAEPVSAEPAGIQAAWSWTGYEAADTGRNAAEPVPAPELTVLAGIDAGFSRLLPVAGRTDAEISSAETLHMAANVETPEDMAETAAFNPAFGKKAVLSEGAEETPEGEAAEVMVPAAAPEPAVPPAGFRRGRIAGAAGSLCDRPEHLHGGKHRHLHSGRRSVQGFLRGRLQRRCSRRHFPDFFLRDHVKSVCGRL